jgi:glutamate racemase
VSFVGMEPALKPAAERTRTRHVGVIATAATFQGELFASLVDRYAADVTVHTQVCARLVPLVEAGELDTPLARAAVEEYLAPLVAAGVDELVLGCTHYPFLQPLIEEVIGPDVEVIDPAAAVARQAGRVLAQAGWMIGDERNVIEGDCFVPQGCCAIANDAPRSGGHCRDAFGPAVWGTRNDGTLDRFYTTGDPARFEDALQRLLGFRAVVQPAMWNTDGQLRLPR